MQQRWLQIWDLLYNAWLVGYPRISDMTKRRSIIVARDEG